MLWKCGGRVRFLDWKRVAPALDAYAEFFYPAYGAQLCHADPGPGRAEFHQDNLRNMLGQGFQQGKVLLRERFVYAPDDKGVVQRIFDFVRPAGAAVGKRYFQIELDDLFHVAFPRVYADQGFDLEFVQKDNVH